MRPSRQIGSSSHFFERALDSSAASHAQTTNRPPARRMRCACAKNALKSGMCSELSIAIAASKESDGRSFVSQSPRRNCGFELPALRLVATSYCAGEIVTPVTSAPRLGEQTRGRAITAADIANARARGDSCVLRDEFGQLQDGLLARFIAAQPEAVMHMLAPDIAIEVIQLVVMRARRRRG